MSDIDLSKPINLSSQAFCDNKFDYYRAMLEKPGAYSGKISVIKLWLVAGHDESVAVTKDKRLIRNRSVARGGGGRFPFPLPKSVQYLAVSMIQEDGEPHARLRNLVNKAFTPRAVAAVGERFEALAYRALEGLEEGSEVDLIESYSSQIPSLMIAEMMGIHSEEMPRFRNSMTALSKGLSGWSLLRTLAFDLRRTSRFIRDVIERKRSNPGDDILTRLIEVEEEGDRLSEDELVSMVFLLVIAGFETTTHQIANGVVELLKHPEQLERFRKEPEIQNAAVEEMLRFAGPVHGTKLNYATEDIDDYGPTIKRGEAVMPLLGAANRDPRVFEDPDTFDIGRESNHHVAFSQGPHFCLGAHLARLETRIAIRDLFERFPGLQLAHPDKPIEYARMPGWHRMNALPVVPRT